MKKILFSVVAVMMIFTSCGTDAVKFSNTIIKEQTSILPTVQEYSNTLSQVATSRSFENLKSLGDSLTIKLDKSIQSIKGLDTPSGGEKFKEAAIEYFQSAKKMTTLGDKAASLGKDPSQENMTTFIQEISVLDNEVNEKGNAFISAQKEFAKEKGMKLQ